MSQLICIFIFQDAIIHGWVGIAVMSAAVLQVFGGIVRPGPKSDFRVVFNWGHWFLGKSTHILAGNYKHPSGIE